MKMNWSGLVFQNEDHTKLENAVVGDCFGLISRTILIAGQAFRSQT